jgi:molybdate transport system substrate-binding protein
VLLGLMAATGAVPAACGERAAPPRSVTVFAASSTGDVLREIAAKFKESHGVEVRLNLDASSNLARQIKAGAPADVFISADERWMNDVAAAGAVRPETIQPLLGNQLVLVVPADAPHPRTVRAARGQSLDAQIPGLKRLAMGDPAHVPAGRYARQSLEGLGWWAEVESRLITTPDVRAALRLVELGEVDAGIVYATDARGSERVTVAATLPKESHEPIRYPAAITAAASADAPAFVAFLGSPDAAALFERAGFVVLPPEGGGR